MQRKDGANTALKNVSLKGRKMAIGLNVIIAEKRFTELLKILSAQRVKNSFVLGPVIVHGKMKIDGVAKMPLIG